MLASFLKSIIKIIGSLPLKLRQAFGRLLGYLYFLLPSKEKEVAKLQMQYFLGQNKDLKKVFMSLGQSVMESFNLKPLLDKSKKYS